MNGLRAIGFTFFALVMMGGAIEGWIYFIAWCVREATSRGWLP